MQTRQRWIVCFIVIGLLALSLACGGSDKGSKATEVPATPTPAQMKPTATPKPAQPEPESVIELGELQRNEDGGFVFRVIPDYELVNLGGMVNMTAPGADPDVGPVVTLVGWVNDYEKTNADLYAQLKSETPMTVGAAEDITVHGVPGLAADITGDNNGKPMQGRAALVMATPTQQFMLLVGAPADQWAAVAPYFDAVLASIEFFEPVIPPPTSHLEPGWYPYTDPNVARDVLVYDGVVYAATLGGVVIWEVSPTLEDGFPTVYTTLDGMSHVSANALTVCDVPVASGGRETRIVVGALTGLSFYDPMTGVWDAQSITPEEARIQANKVDRLYCDAANNRLLIGYSGLGILDLETGAWTRFTDKEGLSWNGISDIAVIGRDIWVASGYNGISKISGDQVTVYDESNGLPNKRANALAVGADGALWVGTSGGLAQFKNNQWKFYASKDVSGLADIRELAFAADGTLWVGTSSIGGGNLCRFDPRTETCVEKYQDPNGVLGLDLYHNGAPLFVNSAGLHALVEGEKNSFLVSGVLPASNSVQTFAAAPDGMLWVGTGGGAQQLDPSYPDIAWDTYTRADGLGGSSSSIAALTVAPDGTVWAAITNGDVSRFREGTWTTYEGLRSYDSVVVDAQGRAWFGDNGKGIAVLNADGSPAMKLTTAEGLPTDNVQALLADGDTIWIALDKGLARYANGEVEVVLDKDSTPHPYMRALAFDPQGALLIGANLSILRYDGSAVEVLHNFQTAGHTAWLTALAVAPNGQLWAGTQNGVFYSDDGVVWQHLTTADGLLTNFISALHVDQYGAVWIGGGSDLAGGGLLHIVP